MYLLKSLMCFLCLSETYLESSTVFDDANLEIPGYILVKADTLRTQKRRCLLILQKFSAIRIPRYSLLTRMRKF